MKKISPVLIMLFIATSSNAQLNRIDHFYISSSESGNIFDVFVSQFNLPVQWDYSEYGSFSSGAVTLGNVVFEFVNDGKEDGIVTYGIALEPKQNAEGIIPILDAANVDHLDINEASFWNTIQLSVKLSEKFNLFICDYHDRDWIHESQRNAARKLSESDGGALGIIRTERIALGLTSPDSFLNELQKLPGISHKDGSLFFQDGPEIQVIRSSTDYFELVLKVQSIDRSQAALISLGISQTKSGESLTIDEEQFGMRIVLVQ